MEIESVLVPDSLQETLWRLEEVRRGFRSKSDAQVQEALDWVLSRQGLKGSYSNLFSPTSQELTQGVRLLTGLRIGGGGGARHILGEEALRTVIVWDLRSSPAVLKALEGFNRLLERGGETGFYCCHICTVAFLRTLAVVRPTKGDEILEKGFGRMREARTANGKWRGFPFYYTLLALSEIDSFSAQAELRHAGRIAESLMKRYLGTDRTSNFRRVALKAAVNAARDW